MKFKSCFFAAAAPVAQLNRALWFFNREGHGGIC